MPLDLAVVADLLPIIIIMAVNAATSCLCAMVDGPIALELTIWPIGQVQGKLPNCETQRDSAKLNAKVNAQSEVAQVPGNLFKFIESCSSSSNLAQVHRKVAQVHVKLPTCETQQASTKLNAELNASMLCISSVFSN